MGLRHKYEDEQYRLQQFIEELQETRQQLTAGGEGHRHLEEELYEKQMYLKELNFKLAEQRRNVCVFLSKIV